MTEYVVASRFLGRLWSASLPTFRLPEDVQDIVHIPDVFDPVYLQGMPLPLAGRRSLEQTVALVDEAEFRREVTDDAIASAYQEQRRTRVYEGMDVRSDGWFSVASLQLARLARCRVVCSMYESDEGDQNMGAHVDEWFGAIVQMHGAKKWTLWPRADGTPKDVLTEAGDMLLLPRNIKHAVSTPDYSVHLVFAFITGEPFG